LDNKYKLTEIAFVECFETEHILKDNRKSLLYFERGRQKKERVIIYERKKEIIGTCREREKERKIIDIKRERKVYTMRERRR